MKFGTKNVKPELTKEIVLSKINELDIFNLFSEEEIYPNVTICSPLRIDNRPSFVVLKSYKKLIWFDFKFGHTGDVFDFVMLKCKCNFKEALVKIIDRVNKGYTPIKCEEDSISNYKKELISFYTPFTEKDKEFWQSFNISRKTLTYFNCTAISKYTLDGYTFNSDNLAYKYKVGNRIKLYQPFSKDYKYFGNTNKNSIQGYEFMNFSKSDLYIVASYKEIMIMHELGFTAIAPNSESSLFKKEIMEYLHSKFTRIYVLFDWDDAGKAASLKYHNYYNNLELINIPKSTEEKDLSDYSKKYGLQETLKLIKKWQN
tara:strand:+ start:3703 stop:4647 length:945 start_codon:yes stop_codon:yes gene_type:complete